MMATSRQAPLAEGERTGVWGRRPQRASVARLRAATAEPWPCLNLPAAPPDWSPDCRCWHCAPARFG